VVVLDLALPRQAFAGLAPQTLIGLRRTPKGSVGFALSGSAAARLELVRVQFERLRPATPTETRRITGFFRARPTAASKDSLGGSLRAAVEVVGLALCGPVVGLELR
jgi:hypothetical protein